MPFEKTIKNVAYLTPVQEDKNFSDLYINLRTREGRFLGFKEIQTLPVASTKNKHFKEWQMRAKSAQRFVEYLKAEAPFAGVLELGCGNGWFAHLLAKECPNTKVYGLDINELELMQAGQCFHRDNLSFAYADIIRLNEHSFNEKIDLIVLNASVQYFDNLPVLFEKLASLMQNNGELHILDSPFYEKSEIGEAQKRTAHYYQSIGFREMAKYYFHHCIETVHDFDILYQPKRLGLKRVFGFADSPFPWLRKVYD
ncbi:class I SAM-dependent methyltransferase [Marinilongibacter aquaticus]|uniref:class I SAM-dependent methyltransferase n=1 Tax=Marinilongibacter aquaticus TaxID=2975157 RepID=UPI0021BD2A33|nr:class I SAM-dependent methyltransferase [Marinilongibacter aquaticus]UBM59293.1 class I SAM-dependent methyltransferase [Marinilongibacter aquaticus]